MATFEQLRAAMRNRADDMRPAMEAATKANADLIVRESVKNMDRDIYAKPPDPKKGATKSQLARAKQGGKGRKWTRTGNLKREEQVEHQGLTSIIHNRAKAKSGRGGYAHARHNLALVSGDPRIIPPPPSIERQSERVAPFRAQAIIDTEEKRLDNYRQGALSVLRRNKV